MAIAHVNNNYVAGTTIDTSTHAVGDFLVICGWRVASVIPRQRLGCPSERHTIT